MPILFVPNHIIQIKISLHTEKERSREFIRILQLFIPDECVFTFHRMQIFESTRRLKQIGRLKLSFYRIFCSTTKKCLGCYSYQQQTIANLRCVSSGALKKLYHILKKKSHILSALANLHRQMIFTKIKHGRDYYASNGIAEFCTNFPPNLYCVKAIRVLQVLHKDNASNFETLFVCAALNTQLLLLLNANRQLTFQICWFLMLVSVLIIQQLYLLLCKSNAHCTNGA